MRARRGGSHSQCTLKQQRDVSTVLTNAFHQKSNPPLTIVRVSLNRLRQFLKDVSAPTLQDLPTSTRPMPPLSPTTSPQLDWVTFTRAIASYWHQVATRFANAGINENAIHVGLAVCSSFIFRKEGQQELTESLRKLEGRPSYQKLLWFGFGIRHVIHNLTDTEQGAACVALCAALAHHYPTDHAANVMTALCHQRGAPNHIVPSIEQWSSLISVCEGSLAKSKFPHYFDIFTRFLVPEPSKAREPADAKTMAEALALLGDISKQELNSVLMVGGVECAWLAAFAERLLGLTIEILDEKGNRRYRSSRRLGGPAEVTFIRKIVQGATEEHQDLVRRKYFVSSGRELLLENSDLFSSTSIRISTTWSTVLSDSFPKAGYFLVQTSYQKQLAALIRCVARKSQAYYTSSTVEASDIDSTWWIHWEGQGCLFHPRRTGLELLNFVSELFRELAFVGNSDDFGSTSMTKSESLEDSVKDIADTCGCPSCSKSKRVVDLEPLCRTRFALTLIRLILILSPVTIHESVPPSVMALRQLYNCTNVPQSGTPARTIPCHGLLLIHSLFTGAHLYRANSAKVSAVCGKGVCVFYSLLRDIELPPSDAMYIEVIPGQIRHGEYSCKYVVDISPGLQEHLPNINFLQEICSENGPGFSIDLIAEKRQVDEAIAASYRFLSADNRPVYLNTTTVQEALLSSLRMCDSHPEDCNRHLEVEPGPQRWCISECPETSSEAAPKLTHPESRQETSWAVVTWQAWDTPKVDGKSYQNIEIDVYRPGNRLLFPIVSYLHLKHMQALQLPHSQRRERILVAELANCSSCVARRAVMAWYKATKEKQASAEKVARFDDTLKRGLIKKRGSIGSEVDEDIKFELAPDLVDQDSTGRSRRPWKFLFGSTWRDQWRKQSKHIAVSEVKEVGSELTLDDKAS